MSPTIVVLVCLLHGIRRVALWGAGLFGGLAIRVEKGLTFVFPCLKSVVTNVDF